MNFYELKKMNNDVIEETKRALDQDKMNENLRRKLIVNAKIGELLEKDEGLFFNITIEEASKIIEQIVDDKEAIQDIYLSLTSLQEYTRLKEKFKI